MSRVLVINCGSSTVKFRLFDGESTKDTGLIETTDFDQELRGLLHQLDLSGLDAIGHRVVHGGTRFAAPTLINDAVVEAIRGLIPLAPLHNPANLAGIEIARSVLPDAPQVAVFDTAFHRTLPPEAASYAINPDLAERLGIQRYGFHGTSHAYVFRRTAELLGRAPAEVNVITLHLGNGASACAVAGGRSVATSMGMSPLEGLVMGTRSGDLDPAIIFHLNRVGGMGLDKIDDLLNKGSGLRGMCGDSDMRAVLRRVADGDPTATLAFDLYCQRVREYVGAYYATLGRVDAIAFTAGVGEHAAQVRSACLAGLRRLGIAVDEARNAGHQPVISPEGAEVMVCVVPTDEELEIADQARRVVGLP